MGTRASQELEDCVMVFPAELLAVAGYFQGVSLESEKYLELILDEKHHRFIRRRDAEADHRYKQLIPYAIARCEDTIFAYRRGKLLAEERLLGSYSIGIGGHISIHDPNLFGATYEEGMRREIDEEIEIGCTYREEIVGVINDDSNDVGRVHFGVIHILTLDRPEIRAREKSVNEGKFLSLSQLKMDIQRFENWSQICIQELDRLLSLRDHS